MTVTALVSPLEMAVQQARELDTPLKDRLSIIADSIRILNPIYAEAVDRMVMRFQKADVGANVPAPGEVMPRFMLPDERGDLVSLDHILAHGPVAISFNRGHWCPFCRINVLALAEILDQVKEMDGQIVAITPERRRFTTALQADARAPFPILTDMDNGYALSLNLAIWVGEEIQHLLARAGRDLPSYQSNQGWMLPIPATFVVGTDGVVAARYLDPDFRLRMDIDQLLTALKAVR